jgi:hypothetical protein
MYEETRITMTRKTYTRTASGKGWKKNPDTVETEDITRENYDNRASRDTIRFWNGFCGGTCRAEYGYSAIGYTPYKITLVSPSREEKIVETYRIR